jgi:muramoyltetrapeptide carboxypeptidase LdcA involved in peptidoglycan recycling
MDALMKPKKLNPGDTIATISISGGRAGDPDMIDRYYLGKRRLEEIFGLHVVETPHALKGSDFLYQNPKCRADDLHQALLDPKIKAIIANMGGDDSYRLLPYINYDIIRNNPKIYMGYSDITTTHLCFYKAGVMSYYGANILTPIAQPGSLDEHTEMAIRKTLFSNQAIGKVLPTQRYTPIEWRDNKDDIVWQENHGYELIQGTGIVQGRLFGGCAGPLRQIMGTSLFPKEDVWNGCIVFLDFFSPYGNVLAGLHELRALNAAGVFKNAKGLLTPKLDEEEKKMVLKFFKAEVERFDLPILTNVDFGHRTPMTVLPIGAMAEIDCAAASFSILESGVE